ncbi:serine protease [Nocardia sp. NBC_00403]|uniref:serine protease n=1 Tax=Nocardia sp. NBC_00403 TaxID=2975990 RepID=UPI002E20AD9F
MSKAFVRWRAFATVVFGASALVVGMSTPASAIVGGYVAADDQFPWTVSVQKGGAHACGGAALNSRTVITSAMCVRGVRPEQLKLRYGSLRHDSGGSVVDIEKIVVHPRYDVVNRENDIAVLHTSENLSFGTNAATVCLPEPGSDPGGGVIAQASGWGALREGGETPSQLMGVDLPTVSRQQAQGQYGVTAVTANMIAAGLDAGGKSPGAGDEGSPLVARSNDKATLVGLYSWAGGNARPGYSAVFTRVGGYVDNFLADNMLGAGDGSTTDEPCGQPVVP